MLTPNIEFRGADVVLQYPHNTFTVPGASYLYGSADELVTRVQKTAQSFFDSGFPKIKGGFSYGELGRYLAHVRPSYTPQHLQVCKDPLQPYNNGLYFLEHVVLDHYNATLGARINQLTNAVIREAAPISGVSYVGFCTKLLDIGYSKRIYNRPFDKTVSSPLQIKLFKADLVPGLSRWDQACLPGKNFLVGEYKTFLYHICVEVMGNTRMRSSFGALKMRVEAEILKPYIRQFYLNHPGLEGFVEGYKIDGVYDSTSDESIWNPAKFDELMNPFSDADVMDVLDTVIDEKLIRELDKVGLFRFSCILQWKGKTVLEAYVMSLATAPWTRAKYLHKNEIVPLQGLEKEICTRANFILSCSTGVTVPEEASEWGVAISVYRYLLGLEEPAVTKENAREILNYAKAFDLCHPEAQCRCDIEVLKRTTFKLRLQAYYLDPENITLEEAFLFSLRKEHLESREHRACLQNWVPEWSARMARAQGALLPAVLKAAKSLDTIIAMRGIPGSGKSTFLKKFEARAVMSIDALRAPLIKGIDLSTSEVQKVVTLLFDDIHERVVHLRNSPSIMDLCLPDMNGYLQMISIPATKLGKKVQVFDLDISLRTALLRILLRDPQGIDPVPPLDKIVSNFQVSRFERIAILGFARTDENVGSYQLYRNGRLIAQKEGASIRVFDKEAFTRCTSAPSEEKIRRILEWKITPEGLGIVHGKKLISARHRYILTARFNGLSLQKAMEKHTAIPERSVSGF